MKITLFVITIVLAGGLFYYSTLEDQEIAMKQLDLNNAPKITVGNTLSQKNLAPIKIKKEEPPTKALQEPPKPIVVKTPFEELKGKKIQKNNQKVGQEIRIFLPKDSKPRNGYLVVVPKSWNAPDNPRFNPLLKKYKAPWVVSLRKRYLENVVSNKKLLHDVYHVMIYKNDGNEGRLPTRIAVYEVASGGYIYINESHWNQLELL